MHQLLTLKFKIGCIVFLTLAVISAGHFLGLGAIGFGTLLGAVEAIVIYGLLNSWHCLSKLGKPDTHWLFLNIDGEWKPIIKSLHPMADNNGPIEGTMKIRQNWLDICFVLETDKMEGKSYVAFPAYCDKSRTLTIRYLYTTNPNNANSELNPPQTLGCAKATIKLEKPNSMTIKYTNERGKGGDIELERIGTSLTQT